MDLQNPLNSRNKTLDLSDLRFPRSIGMADLLLTFLIPTWWEIKVSVAAAIFLISMLSIFSSRDGDVGGGSGEKLIEIVGDLLEDKDKMGQLKGDSQSNSAFVIKLELLAAKNLIGANLNGTSDPYAIITCGEQKRFSSMVPGSRNPMWGEEFNFFVDELPVQVKI
ncbi:Bag-associated gram protein [Thalictrum thalictroides]|uniref:Bag-associated gram protein n=1 Tax=Thalictrum thalictroides TaxID=46969 RepID=A0A7J6WKR1_THATH|nr:Bag-associated gram protein [Thalictrum thalictroides]